MKMGFIFLVVVFLGSYLIGSLLEQNKHAEIFVNKSTCDLLNENCHVIYGNIEYEVSFDGAPSPLIPFNIRLISRNSQPSNIEIEFEMKGMDMGNNFYSLKKQGEYWGVKVLLPVCSLGRNDWILRVNFMYGEKSNITEFNFSQ